MSESELDRLLDFCDLFVHTRKMSEPARAELAQLRSECEELKGSLELGQINCDAVYDDLKSERDAARADNARLTARVAYLENDQRIQAWNETFELCLSLGMDTDNRTGFEAVSNFISINSQPAILTPRNCETCRKAAEEMREAAASVRTAFETDSVLGWKNMTSEEKRMWKAGFNVGQYDMSDAIRDLPLPSFGTDGCAGCAPLKPE